jgi:threonine/homoserine/homoserine lactone efflux protein
VPDTSTLLVFAAAALALIVVPGPAVLYIVAQSIDRGRLAGFVSALGIAVGGLVHVTAAAIGLSSLLVSSATAFAAVKYAGAAYLIGLGLYTLLVRKEEPAAALPRERRLRRRFGQGVVVNVLNPKTAPGRSWPGAPRSGCGVTGGSSECSVTSPDRSSSASAR